MIKSLEQMVNHQFLRHDLETRAAAEAAAAAAERITAAAGPLAVGGQVEADMGALPVALVSPESLQ